jgi:hypothetical protein
MAMGGMAEARKKNMGLKMKRGGSVKKPSKSSSKKSRGTGAAKRGTKFKGTYSRWQVTPLEPVNPTS